MNRDVFAAHRRLLFTVAYEMLGSAADAEDIVQETWLRWADVDQTVVRDDCPGHSDIRADRARQLASTRDARTQGVGRREHGRRARQSRGVRHPTPLNVGQSGRYELAQRAERNGHTEGAHLGSDDVRTRHDGRRRRLH